MNAETSNLTTLIPNDSRLPPQMVVAKRIPKHQPLIALGENGVTVIFRNGQWYQYVEDGLLAIDSPGDLRDYKNNYVH